MARRLRFLITRLSHIGDCVLTLPLAQQLKHFWPDCHITWAMESPSHKLLGHIPEIDEIVLVPKGYLKHPGQILTLRRQLRQHPPDIVLDPQSLTKSAALGWLSGAGLRLGLGGKYRKELSGWLNNVAVDVPPSVTHLVDRTLLLLPEICKHPLAAQTLHDPDGQCQQGRASQAIVANCYPHESGGEAEWNLDLPVPEADQEWARQWQQTEMTKAPIVINPGASWASKRWLPERFAQVATQLHQQTGIPSVITWAGEEEKQWAEQIAAASDQAASIAPSTTLTQLCALCQTAQLFIGCDTGPMHMAAAVGTPCVVLFGPTRPQDSGPYGRQHFALQARYQDGGARERRQADNSAMLEIEVDSVVQACLQVLQSSLGSAIRNAS